MPDSETAQPFNPETTTRPIPALATYYIIASLLTVPLFPFVVTPLLFKYKSLRYKFDDEGVTMSWGILFKKEVYLTYRRIQDIHVSRGILQRQFGLATVSVQTASGTSGAQMAIDGIGDPQGLRDFLYGKMRGSRGETHPEPTKESVASDSTPNASTAGHPASPSQADEALALLREVLDEVRAIRQTDPLNQTGGTHDA